MKSAENDPAGHTIILGWMGGEVAGLHLAPHLGRMCSANRQCLQSITSSRERWYFVLRLFWIHESDIVDTMPSFAPRTAARSQPIRSVLCRSTCRRIRGLPSWFVNRDDSDCEPRHARALPSERVTSLLSSRSHSTELATPMHGIGTSLRTLPRLLSRSLVLCMLTTPWEWN